MPTYEYKCNSCEHAFEKFQSITAEPIKLCPACGKQKARRLISAGAGFIFKGGGFYETDYRSESYKQAAKADSPGSGSATSSDARDAQSTAPVTAKPAAESKPAVEPTAVPTSKPAAKKTASTNDPANNSNGKVEK